MKKVLLAVIGARCDKKAFRYAVQLSRQIHAELDVLQIVSANATDKGPAPEKTPGVRFQRATCAGNPDAEIVSYVTRNRDVVFTIYDASAHNRGKLKAIPKEIKKLPTPLVLVRP